MTGAGADPAVFGAVFAALFAAHQVGDHWAQTAAQACGKGAPNRAGRWLCVRHVATLTVVKAAALVLMAAVVGVGLHPLAVAAALLVDGLSHYWADRRVPLARLACWLGRTVVPGKGEFLELGAPRPGRDDNPSLGTGAYALDQSWHIGWLFFAALIACLGGGVT